MKARIFSGGESVEYASNMTDMVTGQYYDFPLLDANGHPNTLWVVAVPDK